jgi:hypothetical protein
MSTVFKEYNTTVKQMLEYCLYYESPQFHNSFRIAYTVRRNLKHFRILNATTKCMTCELGEGKSAKKIPKTCKKINVKQRT